jgi:hypothetical protein
MKNNFFKNKNYNFNIFLNKKHFKKQILSHSEKKIQPLLLLFIYFSTDFECIMEL